MSKLDKLAAEYRKWCERNYLPFMSADELLVEGVLSDNQYAWVQRFCERWEKVC